MPNRFTFSNKPKCITHYNTKIHTNSKLTGVVFSLISRLQKAELACWLNKGVLRFVGKVEDVGLFTNPRFTSDGKATSEGTLEVVGRASFDNLKTNEKLA